jgi:hypothetical protein
MRFHRIVDRPITGSAVSAITLVASLAVCTSCTPPAPSPAEDGLVTAVAGIVESSSAAAAVTPDTPPNDAPIRVQGSVGGTGDYQFIELGPARAGEQWTVTNLNSPLLGGAFLVVLFDAQYDLLLRQVVGGGASFDHIVRADAAPLYLGVATATGADGGDFRFEIDHRADIGVPVPQPQVVWLNFAGASDLTIHARRATSFGPFDAAALGPPYAGATAVVKAAILETMHEDYAAYNVLILSSDDGPPPAGPYATVHFGSYDAQLLGLADDVDQYNADPWQNAIIYVDGFADFTVMGLNDQEMGVMVGNVASHEFGHLVGLFHTRLPVDIMDTTGTAWDLAGSQSFTRAPLEPSVFPFGYEDSPARLADTVGFAPAPAESHLAKPLSTETMRRKAALRTMARGALRQRCGTCLHLDD